MTQIQYRGLNVNEVRLLTLLIERGLDQDFLRDLFKIEEINWFLYFVSSKRINRLIEWINETYIDNTNQGIAFSLYEEREIEYNLDCSDDNYFGYIQWLLKHKTSEELYYIIENNIDLSHEYKYQHYLTAEFIIDKLRHSEIYEFKQIEDQDPEDALIDKLNNINI